MGKRLYQLASTQNVLTRPDFVSPSRCMTQNVVQLEKGEPRSLACAGVPVQCIVVGGKPRTSCLKVTQEDYSGGIEAGLKLFS